ncbi:MAG: FHA domain-containing protein [Planctomycetota bacterium]|nr:FHA domain-containing protein [Planctomycetota bacterium]
MPSILIVGNDKATATKHWIEQRVLRVGGAAECDIQVDGMTNTAFMLEFRDGRYFVINHSGGDFRIGELQVGNMESSELKPGQILQVGPTKFRIRSEGNPEPCLQPVRDTEHASAYLDGQTAVESEKTGSVGATVSWVALGITGFAFLWVMMAAKKPDLDTSSNFISVIDALIREDSQQESPEIGHVRRVLQQARTAELRGDRKTAFRSYAFVRDMLMKSNSNSKDISDPLKQATLVFIKQRLRRLT